MDDSSVHCGAVVQATESQKKNPDKQTKNPQIVLKFFPPKKSLRKLLAVRSVEAMNLLQENGGEVYFW